MSEDIFMADYGACRDTNREIKSNLNYIDDILTRLNDMNSHVGNVSVPSDVWDKSDYDSGFSNLKKYLNEETERYNNFHSTFESFHTPLKSIDEGLKKILENALGFIDKNKDYGVYMSVIKSSQVDSLENAIYDQLISQGVSKEDALKIAALEDPDSQKLLNDLANMDENELKKKLEEIQNKPEKDPMELLLVDIFSGKDPGTYMGIVKDLSKELSTGGFTGVLQKGFLGKTLDKYNLDAKSLGGQIDKLDQEIRNSQLGKAKLEVKGDLLDKLKNIRESKISKVTTLSKASLSLEELSKDLAIAGYVWEGYKIAKDDYTNYTENGYEADDVAFDTELGIGKIITTAAAAGAGTAAAAGAVGTGVAPGVGTAAGLAGGFVAGAAASLGYDLIVKPIATEINEDIIKPVDNWIEDKENDLGDWWDSLWW